MIFSSLTFLYYFLPAVLILYYIAPKSMKNLVILLGSLVFYGWGEPKHIMIMIISILAGYGGGLWIEIFCIKGEKKRAGWLLFSAVSVYVTLLIYFKFSDEFPIGISFYTFQLLSYLIDIYRSETKAQKNIINMATYIAMFPQLVAGPIIRYKDVENQLVSREHDISGFAYGIRRFVSGLGKKVLMANSFGQLCNIFRASDDKSVLYFWLYAVAFALQIYFDFSGYSDMAIGLGKMFGFQFTENFHYPYIAKSVTEFWRRWHMSLGQWFRDYVYIPLGGNRVSKERWLFNILLVWFLTGFWHGAEWNFILWGLYFAIFLVAEKLWLSKILEKNSFFGHIYLIGVVLIGFVIFNGDGVEEALSYVVAMFGVGAYPLVSVEFFYYIRSYGVTFLVAMLGSTPICKNFWGMINERENLKGFASVIEIAGIVLLLLLTTACLVDGSFNPFLYFRF